MKETNRLRSLCALIGFLMVASAGAEDDVVNLPDVMVESRGPTEKAWDVPVSLTIFDVAEIEAGNLDTFRGISRLTPNLDFYSAGTRRTALYYIRGIGSSGPNPPAVGIFLDDVYLARSGYSDLDFLDVEQVEVLRGPQGTLYGRNTEAGIIRLVTSPIPPYWSGSVQQDVGSYREFKTRASAKGPIVSNTVDAALSFVHHERDGFTKNDFLDTRADDVNHDAARMHVEFSPTETFMLKGSVLAGRDRDGGYAFTQLSRMESNPHHVSYNIPGEHKRDLRLYTVSAEQTHGLLGMKWIGAYTDWQNRDQYDEDFTPLDILRMEDHDNLRALGNEIRFYSTEQQEMTWLLGAYLNHEQAEDDNTRVRGLDAADLGLEPGSSQDTLQDIHSWQAAGYGRMKVPVNVSWNMMVGVRYDYEKKKRDADVLAMDSSGVAISDYGVNDDVLERQWSPEFSLTYEYSPEVMNYVRVARGWRSGGFNDPAGSAVDHYEPEHMWSYELGSKLTTLHDRLFLNAALFYSTIHDQQLIQFNPAGGGFFFSNIGSAESRGGEMTAVWQANRALRLVTAVGYTDATYTDAEDEASGDSWDGNRLPFVPRVNYSAVIESRNPIWRTGDLFARCELTGRSDTAWDVSNDTKTDGYALVDAQLGLETEYWSFRVFVRNLFDEEYAGVVYAFPGSEPIAEAGAPRQWGVRLSLYF